MLARMPPTDLCPLSCNRLAALAPAKKASLRDSSRKKTARSCVSGSLWRPCSHTGWNCPKSCTAAAPWRYCALPWRRCHLVFQPLEHQACDVNAVSWWRVVHRLVVCHQLVVEGAWAVWQGVADQVFSHDDQGQACRAEILCAPPKARPTRDQSTERDATWDEKSTTKGASQPKAFRSGSS